MKTMTECAICYEKCNYKTTCGHSFHFKCLRQWGKPACPMCRQKINSTAYYNTRSQDTKSEVYATIKDLIYHVKYHTLINSLERIIIVKEILEYIWHHRIILRQHPKFIKMVKRKVQIFKSDANTCHSHLLDEITQKLHRLL